MALKYLTLGENHIYQVAVSNDAADRPTDSTRCGHVTVTEVL